MNTVREKVMRFVRRKRYSIPTLLAFILVLVWISLGGNGTESLSTRAAVRTDVFQEVSVTGSVKPIGGLDLAFERSGRVSSVDVAVGERVNEGQRLASLSNADLSAELDSRLASLDRERIALRELERGGTPNEVAVSGASQASAQSDFKNAQAALIDRINDSFSKADDAVRNYADKVFSDPSGDPSYGVTVKSGSTTYNIDTSDTKLKISINIQRRNVEKILDDWKMLAANASNNTVESAAARAESDLIVIQSFLDDVARATNSLDSGSSAANTIYDSYKADVSTARSTVSTALTNLRASIQAYDAKKSAAEIADRQHSLTSSSASDEEIERQMANIREAEARVASARAELAKSIILSPVAGIVTKIDLNVGEIVSANTTLVSMIADAGLEIEVNIPEADIAKIAVGAEADVTFDAYGSDYVAQAIVASIDQAETIIDGVSTYRTILRFTEPDERVKSGMTANIDIKGERKENVIAVPQRAIVTRDGERHVRVMTGNVVEERQVTIGLRGSDGIVEIVSGLTEGEIVVTSAVEE